MFARFKETFILVHFDRISLAHFDAITSLAHFDGSISLAHFDAIIWLSFLFLDKISFSLFGEMFSQVIFR